MLAAVLAVEFVAGAELAVVLAASAELAAVLAVVLALLAVELAVPAVELAELVVALDPPGANHVERPGIVDHGEHLLAALAKAVGGLVGGEGEHCFLLDSRLFHAMEMPSPTPRSAW